MPPNLSSRSRPEDSWGPPPGEDRMRCCGSGTVPEESAVRPDLPRTHRISPRAVVLVTLVVVEAVTELFEEWLGGVIELLDDLWG